MPTFTINIGKQITPAITVRKAETKAFPLKALYIEALDEYFTEVSSKEEQVSLLERLEHLLKTTPQLICFLSLPEDAEERCLPLIAQYLGEDSALEKQLKKQIEDQFFRKDFLAACEKNKIDTVHIGGVYGKACVWDCARGIADNIYAKQLGDKHPNIRYRDTAETYRFRNAIIDEEVTEGYTDGELTFNQLACFPVTECFGVDLGHVKDITSKGEQLYKGKVGESYELFSSLNDASYPKYEALHTHIQHCLSGYELVMLNHSIWASNKTETENSKVDMARCKSSSDYSMPL
jgi:hypothetical protein